MNVECTAFFLPNSRGIQEFRPELEDHFLGTRFVETRDVRHVRRSKRPITFYLDATPLVPNFASHPGIVQILGSSMDFNHSSCFSTYASLRALSFESLTIYLFGTYRTYCVELLYEMKFPGSSMPQPEVDISLISIVIVVFNAG
jgi:hypothetical protein